MNREWLKYNRPVVYLLISAAIVIAIVGGLAQLLSNENQSFTSFIGTFVIAMAFQGIFFIALYVSLASYHPKIAGVAMLLIFVPMLFQYPDAPLAGVNKEFIADYPRIGIVYLFGAY